MVGIRRGRFQFLPPEPNLPGVTPTKDPCVAAVGKVRHRLIACYQKALKESPDAGGKLCFKYVHDKAGPKAVLVSSTITPKSLSECLVGALTVNARQIPADCVAYDTSSCSP